MNDKDENVSSKSRWNEFQKELGAMLKSDEFLALDLISPLTLQFLAPHIKGEAYSLSIQEDEYPGSKVVEVTDGNLLEKLRSVKGQYFSVGFEPIPIYYYEHLQ